MSGVLQKIKIVGIIDNLNVAFIVSHDKFGTVVDFLFLSYDVKL